MTSPTAGSPSPAIGSIPSGAGSPDIVRLAQTLLTLRGKEQQRLEHISKYVRGKHQPVYTPKGASTEYRWLAKHSHHNFLPLVVSVISQNLHVDGYRATGATVTESSTTEDPEPIWQAFRANRMISRQHGVHRAVVKYGAAYVTILPGRLGENDLPAGMKSVPVLRPVSPKRMTALYADEVDDEWPMYSVEEHAIADSTAPGKMRYVVTVMDDQNRYILTTRGASTKTLDYADTNDPLLLPGQQPIMAHGMGICPVVRFLYEPDLDGETDCSGEVEPLIEIQDGINFTTFNLMLAEQFAAYRQRYVTGMAAADETGRPARPFDPGVDRMFAAEDADTRFGEFDVTPLQPYLDTREADIRHMSTIAQVPPYHLLGAMINLSAEALAAARDGLDRKIEELQSTMTDSWRNVFRAAAKASGDKDGWADLTGAVVWRDTSARSFAATIDALGKAAQMLGVPVTELWRRIPGVTADDVNAWIDAVNEKDALAELDKIFQTASTGGQMTGPPTAAEPFQLGDVGQAPVGPPPPPPAPGSPAANQSPSAQASPTTGQTPPPPGNRAVPPSKLPGNQPKPKPPPGKQAAKPPGGKK
jgi:Phage portal protein, SPP1 Gp6-like